MALLFQGGMGLQIFASRDAPGDHGFGLHPVLLDQQGKIEAKDKGVRLDSFASSEDIRKLKSNLQNSQA